MGVLFSEVNFDLIMKDLGKCCLGCQGCQGSDCLVGYAKQCVTSCIKNNVTFVADGAANIPIDTKLFHDEVLMDAIADILHQCKSCKQEHYENCIINVIRSCYEVAIFGDNLEYEGSAFRYLNAVNTAYPELAPHIIELYHSKSSKTVEE